MTLQRMSDKNISAECQNSFDYDFDFKIVVYKITVRHFQYQFLIK